MLDGGIVDVTKGVAITIENINGKGAITNAGSVTIEKGTIEGPITFEKGAAKADNNDKIAGGAIFNDTNAKLDVKNATFTGNTSSLKGGAIFNRDGNVTITSSTFRGNSVPTSAGGAVLNESGDTSKLGTITIKGSTFEGNKAGNGGAVWNGSDGKVEIADSTFKGNMALAEGGLGQGGAITNADQMTITDGSFANNTANYSGGAIYNGAHAAPGQTSLTIDGTTFTGNSVTADFNATKNDNIAGGAIFNDTNAKLDVKNATFTGNTSSLKGGAIFNRDGNVTITSSTFRGNSVPTSAGGAVLNESGDTSKLGTITITGSTFEGNKAGNGGAVWNGFNGTVNITGSTFKGNTAVAGIGQGGAITNADQMTITGSTFEGNQAGKIGGAIFNAASGELNFKGTNTFTNNTAAGKANDIYNAGTITVKDGTTTLNSGLTQVGGNITVNGGTLDMASGSSLSFDKDSKLTIDGGTFVADFGQLLTDYATTNKDNGITDGTSIIGTAGNLNLRLDGGDYTLEDYNAAKDALLEQGEENAALNFLNATLDTEGKDLVVGADKEETEVTITMTPVVVDAGEAPVDAIADGTIPSVPNRIVSVVKADDATKEPLKADTITVQGSEFTAQGLQIDDTESAAAVTLAVTAGSNVTLTGGEAGFTGVVNAENEAVATNVKVEGDATLTVGLEGNEKAQNLVLNAVEVADGSFEVAGNGLDTTQVAANTLEVVDANGSVAVDSASLTVENAVVEHGLLNITNAVADLGTVKATGGVLFFDPSYGTIKSLANNKLGSKLLVSDGSVVNVAFNLEDLQEMARKAGFTTTPIASDKFTLGAGQSMLAVGQPIQLISGGQIVVDAGVDASGSINGTPVSDGAYFGRDSLLVVNGNTINGATAAIDLSGATTKTLNVENGAKLLITDAVAGQKYTVISGATNADAATGNAFNGGTYNSDNSTGWKGSNLLTSSDMLTLTSTDGTVFMAKSEDAHTVFPKLSHELATAVNTLYGQKLNDVDADAMGVRFLSRATDNRFLGSDKDAAASTIESAARIAFAGAVPQMTKMASDAGSNAVVNRLGFANPADGAQAMNAEGKIVDRNTTGFALWIAPLWQSQHGWGMEADNLDYGFNGNLGGVSLGADYTFENAIRAGITFNIGGGYAESSGGDLNSTENRMSFWGLGAYAGWNYENFGLMADVSYTSTWNDLQQDMDSRMGMGDLEADVQASAISAGLRAEYKLETSVLDVIPHIGVRYMSLNTWGFDAESNGGTVLEGDGFHQDIWTFPVGLTFTKDFTLDSGWSFKPSIDFSVIPAAGDIKAKQDVAFTGLPGTYEVETQMMDYLTWQGGVGLELGNDTMSFGVNYTLQAGQHTTGHGVFGSFRYEF
ncbi:autotransporter domain-containing protein [Desulfovibrio sp. SGI.133]|uniref:autotransporter domain-containing protein n=1 Tax=Desulfovibrio sp. SGI.133 TaxID=3420560 RepID=UPI003CFCBBE6